MDTATDPPARRSSNRGIFNHLRKGNGTMKTTKNGMKCPKCKAKAFHVIRKGRLRPDPKHPDDRKYDDRPVWFKCLVCGDKVKSVECPNLLMDLFSI